MELFRIQKKKYLEAYLQTGEISLLDLSYGASLAGGRWNNKGKSLLYTSQSRALAILEGLVHLVSVNNLTDYMILILFAPDDTSLEAITDSMLDKDWKANSSYTQTIGDTWVTKNETALLRVPSAVVSKEYNYLVNPNNLLSKKIKVLDIEPFTFDHRLKK